MGATSERRRSPARRAEQRRQLLALLAAGLIHGAGLLVLVAPSPPEEPAAPAHEQPDELGIELELIRDPAFGGSKGAAKQQPADAQKLAKATLGARASTRPSAADPSELEGVPETDVAPLEDATDDLEPSELEPDPADRHLSLSDLGVGNSKAHWRIPQGNPISRSSAATRKRRRKQQLEARIEKEMAQKALERDVKRGIGPGGPVLTALEGVARVSSAPIRGYAVFQITTDAAGNVTGVVLMDSNGGAPQWGAVGHEVRRRLAGQRLRVGGKPTRLLVRIESTESLPSGADPGLAIDAFGIPIKKGEGKKSARLSIFTPPQFVEVEVPKAGDPKKTIKMPMFIPPNIFGAGGDLADIGGKRRRMVHSRILKAEALAPPRKASARKTEGRQDPPAAPRED